MGTQAPSGGGGKGAGDVRAGGGFWELNLKDKLTGALDKIQARVKGFAANLSRIGTGAMAGGAALGAGPLGLLFGGANRLADTARMARQFEIPIQMMGKFQHAAERAGVSVEEVMNDTRGRFKDLLAGAPLIDPKEAEAALQVQNDFKDSIEALQRALTPVLKLLAPIVSETAKFIQQNAEGAKVVGALSLAMVGLGAAAKLTGISIVGVFAAVTSPIGLAVAAVAGLTAAFVTQTEAGARLGGMLTDTFKVFGEVFGETWKGVTAAVSSGDLEQAFEVLAAGVSAIWAELMVRLRKMWNAFVLSVLKVIKDNPALAPVLGAGVGFVAGGPLGAFAGGAAGVGANFFAEDIANALLVDVDAAEGRRAAARGRLRGAAGAAVAAAPGLPAGIGDAEAKRLEEHNARKAALASGYDSIKGGFNASSALQQFGFGDKAEQQTELMKAQLAEQKKTAAEVAKLVNALMLR